MDGDRLGVAAALGSLPCSALMFFQTGSYTVVEAGLDLSAIYLPVSHALSLLVLIALFHEVSLPLSCLFPQNQRDAGRGRGKTATLRVELPKGAKVKGAHVPRNRRETGGSRLAHAHMAHCALSHFWEAHASIFFLTEQALLCPLRNLSGLWGGGMGSLR